MIPISEITGAVVDLCIKIHSTIGPGCFEKVYEKLLYYELTRYGFGVKRQMLLPVRYESLFIKDAYKLDLLVENRLVLEIKAVHPLPIVYYKKIHTYLAMLELKHGMLLNFKEHLMKHGIHRVFHNQGDELFNPENLKK